GKNRVVALYRQLDRTHLAPPWVSLDPTTQSLRQHLMAKANAEHRNLGRDDRLQIRLTVEHPRLGIQHTRCRASDDQARQVRGRRQSLLDATTDHDPRIRPGGADALLEQAREVSALFERERYRITRHQNTERKHGVSVVHARFEARPSGGRRYDVHSATRGARATSAVARQHY